MFPVHGMMAATIGLVFLSSCQKEEVVEKTTEAPPLAEKLKLPPEDRESAALVALEGFFKAKDMVSRAKAAKDGARVYPMMLDYYEARGHPLPAYGRVSRGKEADFGGVPMVFFDIEAYDGPHYLIAVVWDGERFAVDWESLTAYGTMDWSDFLEEKPDEPQVMRLYLLGAHGIPSFPGTEEGSAVFRLEHRDHPQPLIATAAAVLSKELSPMVEGQRVPVTLELGWKPIGPGGAKVPVILRMVAPGWSP